MFKNYFIIVHKGLVSKLYADLLLPKLVLITIMKSESFEYFPDAGSLW